MMIKIILFYTNSAAVNKLFLTTPSGEDENQPNTLLVQVKWMKNTLKNK